MEFRNSDARHVEWVKALKNLYQQLKQYVKQHHVTGPSWNPKGTPLKDYKAGSKGPAPSPQPNAPASASAPAPPGRF